MELLSIFLAACCVSVATGFRVPIKYKWTTLAPSDPAEYGTTASSQQSTDSTLVYGEVSRSSVPNQTSSDSSPSHVASSDPVKGVPPPVDENHSDPPNAKDVSDPVPETPTRVDEDLFEPPISNTSPDPVTSPDESPSDPPNLKTSSHHVSVPSELPTPEVSSDPANVAPIVDDEASISQAPSDPAYTSDEAQLSDHVHETLSKSPTSPVSSDPVNAAPVHEAPSEVPSSRASSDPINATRDTAPADDTVNLATPSSEAPPKYEAPTPRVGSSVRTLAHSTPIHESTTYSSLSTDPSDRILLTPSYKYHPYRTRPSKSRSPHNYSANDSPSNQDSSPSIPTYTPRTSEIILSYVAPMDEDQGPANKTHSTPSTNTPVYEPTHSSSQVVTQPSKPYMHESYTFPAPLNQASVERTPPYEAPHSTASYVASSDGYENPTTPASSFTGEGSLDRPPSTEYEPSTATPSRLSDSSVVYATAHTPTYGTAPRNTSTYDEDPHSSFVTPSYEIAEPPPNKAPRIFEPPAIDDSEPSSSEAPCASASSAAPIRNAPSHSTPFPDDTPTEQIDHSAPKAHRFLYFPRKGVEESASRALVFEASVSKAPFLKKPYRTSTHQVFDDYDHKQATPKIDAN